MRAYVEGWYDGLAEIKSDTRKVKVADELIGQLPKIKKTLEGADHERIDQSQGHEEVHTGEG